MNINYMQEFACLAKTLSFSRAARELGISETTLSRHILLLEKELGVSLFNRDTRNVELGPYGTIFLEHVEEFLFVQTKYKDKLERMQKSEKEVLNIFCMCYIGNVVEEFQKKYPAVKINLLRRSANYRHELEYIRSGKAEILFIEAPREEVDVLCCIPFRVYEYMALLPQDDPLAKDDVVEIQALKDREFALIMNQWMNGIGVRQIRALYDIWPKAVFYFNEIPPLINCVSKAKCVAIVRKDKIVEAYSNEVAVKRLNPKVQRTIYMCYDKTASLSPLARAFVEFVTEYVEKK